MARLRSARFFSLSGLCLFIPRIPPAKCQGLPQTRNASSWLLFLFLVTRAAAAGAALQGTSHDFTVSREPAGPKSEQPQGTAAAASREAGVCVFCHTPHNANPQAGLWSHRLSAVTYRLYESPTLQAHVNQPTGASRLCLSCHDGTLALGDLRARPRGVRITSGPLRGSASLGTDLSDDHPISFVYDMELVNRNGQLADPGSLPKQVRLEPSGELQCPSCHEPHEEKYEKFLVMDNRGGRLCTTCHRLDGWRDSSHATSGASQRGPGSNPWPHTSFLTVADNGCANCHQQHAAGHPEWLLLNAAVSEGCFTCHDGSLASKDIRGAFLAVSVHPIEPTESLHQPNEDPLIMKRHVACGDCHEPHSLRTSARASGAGDQASLGSMDVFGAVDGVDASGTRIRRARAEYEVCYKCHGLQEQGTSLTMSGLLLTRQDDVTNVRLQFSTDNASFHPVEAIGQNPTIQGLEASYTPSSLLTCTDCHNSSESDTPGGQGPRGPHGSVYEPILIREYQVEDPSTESFQSYALCYRCHNRGALLSDAGGFPHSTHVIGQHPNNPSDEGASCVVCHDAHGSRQNPFLINFLVRGSTGTEVVTPASGNKKIEFQPRGAGGTGNCSLTCHGASHEGDERTEYPVHAAASGRAAPFPLQIAPVLVPQSSPARQHPR